MDIKIENILKLYDDKLRELNRENILLKAELIELRDKVSEKGNEEQCQTTQ